MAVAVACVAGRRLQARGRVRAAGLEFLGSGEDRNSHRRCLQEWVLLGLTGWQMGIVLVCGARALSCRILLGCDPAAAFAAGLTHAGRPGVQRVSAAAVAGQSMRASDASMPFLLSSGLFH